MVVVLVCLVLGEGWLFEFGWILEGLLETISAIGG